MTDTPARTLVLGFDALSFDYLDAFADDLPHLSALRERGVEAPLASTFPPWTGSAWPSLYTGTTPSHHGVHGFFKYGGGYPDDAEINSRADVRAPAIWDYLSARDVPSIVCNVPVTHPAEPIEGVLIPGYLAGADAPFHPERVREELDEAVGGYRIYAESEGAAEAADAATKLDQFVELIELRARAANYLLANEPWEFAMIQVQKTDSVFHTFDDPAAHRRAYEAADELVGTVLETVGDDVNVVVCSDHGMGPTTGYKVYVNEILRRHGFVEASAEGTQLSLGKGAFVGEEADDGAGEGRGLGVRALKAVERGLRRVGVTPGDVYGLAKRAGVETVLRERLPGVGNVGEYVDWAASAAYVRNASELGVRINLEGREPNGVVPRAEYEAVRDELIDLLSGLETPDGEPVFEFVERGEDVDPGPHREEAPDVAFMPADMNHAVATSLLGTEFVPTDTYEHKRNGVFVGAGPAFDSAASPVSLSITDVAPVAMASLGRPVPTRMTGAVPDGLLTVPVATDDYGDVGCGSGVDRSDDDDDDRVMDRLADLGYV